MFYNRKCIFSELISILNEFGNECFFNVVLMIIGIMMIVMVVIIVGIIILFYRF